MILSELKSFFGEHKAATLAQLETVLDYDRAVILQALDTLIQKGRVEKLSISQDCGNCKSSCISKSCTEDDVDIFHWIQKYKT